MPQKSGNPPTFCRDGLGSGSVVQAIPSDLFWLLEEGWHFRISIRKPVARPSLFLLINSHLFAVRLTLHVWCRLSFPFFLIYTQSDTRGEIAFNFFGMPAVFMWWTTLEGGNTFPCIKAAVWGTHSYFPVTLVRRMLFEMQKLKGSEQLLSHLTVCKQEWISAEPQRWPLTNEPLDLALIVPRWQGSVQQFRLRQCPWYVRDGCTAGFLCSLYIGGVQLRRWSSKASGGWGGRDVCLAFDGIILFLSMICCLLQCQTPAGRRDVPAELDQIAIWD